MQKEVTRLDVFDFRFLLMRLLEVLVNLWELLDILHWPQRAEQGSPWSAATSAGDTAAREGHAACLPDVMNLVVTALLVPGHLQPIDHEDGVPAACLLAGQVPNSSTRTTGNNTG